MRRPQERLSQRQFTFELRRAVDQGRVLEAIQLLLECPRAYQSSHVQHNLGARRRAWLSEREAFVRSSVPGLYSEPNPRRTG